MNARALTRYFSQQSYKDHDDGKIINLENDDAKVTSLENDDGRIINLVNDDGRIINLENDDDRIINLEQDDGKTINLEQNGGKIINLENDDGKIINLVNDDSDHNSSQLDAADIVEFLHEKVPPVVPVDVNGDVYDDPLEDNFGLLKSEVVGAEQLDPDISQNFKKRTDANETLNRQKERTKIEDIVDPAWGPKRRRKDYVETFKISKPVRAEEDEPDYDSLYCESCEKYFRNESEKLAHEMSKAHKDNFCEPDEHFHTSTKDEDKAHESDSNKTAKTIEDSAKRESEVQEGHFDSKSPQEEKAKGTIGKMESVKETPDIPGVEIDPKIAEMINEDGPKLRSEEVPASFKAWADKSIAAALRTAKVNKDPYLVAYVRKEVAYELIRNKRACNLYRMNWGRVPLASGSAVKPRRNLNIMLTMDQVRKMDTRAASAEQE